MIRTQKRLRLCITLLICNLIFIWGNSMLPGQISGALSRWLKNAILSLVGMQGTGGEGGHGLLRKLMHFTEFACLGMCLRWLFGMLRKKSVQCVAFAFGAGVSAALIDEGIQMLVPLRGPSFYDVGIDTMGLTLGIVLISLIQLLKKSKNMEENKL